MPEGDTIWRTAAALRRRLEGRRLRSARPARLARLAGQAVARVEPVGKHLLIGFDGGLALHTHMRMTGSWHLYSPGEPWRRPARQARVVLEFDDTVAVCFNAPLVELVKDDGSATANLGPDILAIDFDPACAVARARASDRAELGDLLLDQRVCAGVGNIHRCDTLWALRRDPWMAAADLDDATLGSVYAVARDRMRRAATGGSFSRLPGVHGRAGRPCPRCATPVLVRAQGAQARLTYWCPRCQPATGAGLPARAATPPPRRPGGPPRSSRG